MKKPDKPAVSIIKLSSGHDIVAIIEALRFNEDKQFNFILNEPPYLFYKPFNYKLLKDITDLLGKDLVLVTKDQVVVKLAQQFDLKVSPTPVEDWDQLEAKSQVEPEALKTEVKKTKKEPKKLDEQSPVDKHKPRFNFKGLSRLQTYLSHRPIFLKLGAGIMVIGLLFLAYTLIPRSAIVTIQTDLTTLRTNLEVNLSTTATEVDLEKQILPLKMISMNYKNELDIVATGQVDGARASGIVEIYNCHPQNNLVIDASTVFQRDGKNYRLQAQDLEVIIPPSIDIEDCQSSPTNVNRKSLRIIAERSGEAYNFGIGSYEILGRNIAYYNVVGSVLDGGRQATVCPSDQDIAQAKISLTNQRRDANFKRDLRSKLESEDYIPIDGTEGTFQVAEGSIIEPNSCPNQDSNVISQNLVYYMGGVSRQDLEAILYPSLKLQAKDLDIVDYGLNGNCCNNVKIRGSTQAEASLEAPADLDYYLGLEIISAKAGVNFDKDQIIRDIAGKRANVVAANLRHKEGVKSVTIKLSPSWVVWDNNLPSNPRDIELEIIGN